MIDIVDKLRKLTPIQAGIVMMFVTLVVPFALTFAASYGTEGVYLGGYNLVATLWGVGPIGNPSMQIRAFHPLDIIPSLILSIPNIIFSCQIIRYLKGKTSSLRTLIFGIIGFLFPFTVTISRMISLLEYGYLTYSGSLPFQIIMGLILMKYPGPPAETPWESEEAYSESWYE